MRYFLIWLTMCYLVVGVASAQNYRLVVENADTLVAATADTTDQHKLYSGSTAGTRPVRPTLHILETEIGTNTTHNRLEVQTWIANESLAKDGNGWAKIHTDFLYDWPGYAAGTQNDLAIAMPFLDAYTGQYARYIINAPCGVAADSTHYRVIYEADASGNSYTPPFNGTKIITHFDLFRSRAFKTINGVDAITTDVFDMRIETSPGVFQLPDRGYVTIWGGTKTDDDSVTCYVRGYINNSTYIVNADTLTIPIYGASPFSCTLSGGTGFMEATQMFISGEAGLAADTSDFFAEVHLECDP